MSEIYDGHFVTDTPQPDAKQRELLRFLDRLDRESTQVEKATKQSWESNLSWYRGEQWLIRNRQPLFMANKIAEIGRKKAAKLTEMKPQLLVQSRREGLKTTSGVLQKTIDAGWDEYSMQMGLADLAQHLYIYGVSFLDISYDPYADGGQGDIVPAVIDPRSVHIDPAIARAQDLDRASYLWTEQVMATHEIRQRWPGIGVMVKAGDAEDHEENSVAKFTRQLFAAWRTGGPPVENAIPRSIVKTYFFRDPQIGPQGQLLFPDGRRIIRSGDIILEDGPNPYWDGGWPLVMIDGSPDPEHPWGISDIQMLRRLQDAVNRIGHMFVENSILTGNTWVTYDEGALEPTIMQRLSNIGAVLIGKNRGYEVHRESPPPMPAHMMGFVETALTLMDQLAGLSDTTISSQGRAEVRSDEQLEGLQQAAEVLLRSISRRIESGLERLGQKWVSRIFQFYTRDRVLSYMGPTIEWQTFEFERNSLLEEIDKVTRMEIRELIETNTATKSAEEYILEGRKRAWRNFIFKITPGSSLASTRASRAALHATLAKQGLISGEYVLTDLGFANPKEEIDKARQEAAFLGQSAGQGSNSGQIRRTMG